MSNNDSKELPNLNSLRLPQDFASIVGTKKILTAVPVRKPDRQSWIRVHENPEMRLETAILEYRPERATYLVHPDLRFELWNELAVKTLFFAIDTLNQPFIWPIKMPGPDGRIDQWNQSAMQGAIEAQKQWIRITTNQAKGAHDISFSLIERPEPEWPDKTFQEILQIAFNGRFITTIDHPIVQRLLGKII